MQFTIKLLLIFANALCIVTGQAMMGLIARALTTPVVPALAAREILYNPATYGFVGCYVLSSIIYMALLRIFPLAEVTLSILVVMIVMTAIYTYALGDQMTVRQWLGIAVILLGVIMLQGR